MREEKRIEKKKRKENHPDMHDDRSTPLTVEFFFRKLLGQRARLELPLFYSGLASPPPAINSDLGGIRFQEIIRMIPV